MRSVVVVLPASMWAMMPMLRVFSSEYCRSTASSSAFSAIYDMRRGGSAYGPPLRSVYWLPAIMRERLVGLRHLVRVFSLLHRGAAIAGGIEQLAGQLFRHAPLATSTGGPDDPSHGQGRPSIWAHLDRHLIGRAADPPRLDLDGRLHVVDGRLEHLQGVLLAPVLDRHQGGVHDLLGRRLLAADHHDVDELRHQPASVLRIRQHLALRGPRPSHGARLRPWWPWRRISSGSACGR